VGISKGFQPLAFVSCDVARFGVLRAGYGAFAVSFAAFAGSAYVGELLFLALLSGVVGGFLLAFCDDDLPKWAGIALLGYFALMVIVFLATTPVTINKGGGYFINGAPPEFGPLVLYYVGFVSPVMLAATALAAAWEREWTVRLLLVGALAGCALFAILTFILVPTGSAQAHQQGALLGILFALSGGCGVAGCLWATARPQEFA
jgi:hypothetical protein